MYIIFLCVRLYRFFIDIWKFYGIIGHTHVARGAIYFAYTTTQQQDDVVEDEQDKENERLTHPNAPCKMRRIPNLQPSKSSFTVTEIWNTDFGWKFKKFPIGKFEQPENGSENSMIQANQITLIPKFHLKKWKIWTNNFEFPLLLIFFCSDISFFSFCFVVDIILTFWRNISIGTKFFGPFITTELTKKLYWKQNEICSLQADDDSILLNECVLIDQPNDLVCTMVWCTIN